LAMKMKTFIVGITGVPVLAAIAALVWEVLTVTDPYVVIPLASSTAPASARAGHTVKSGSRTLSIVSSRDVVVVADPGASFKHEVVWIVEQPRKNGSHALKEFTCSLPEYAAVDQIKPLGSSIPTEIQRIANGHRW
jgi:hypothetical protein